MTGFRSGEPETWFTEGPQASPGTSTVLATTGPIGSIGDYQAHIIVSADATAIINFQHRNDTDTGNVTATGKQGEQRLYFGTGGGYAEFIVYWRPTAVNERLRIIPNGSIGGNVSASIFLQKLV